MSDRGVFIARTIAWSIALYALWWAYVVTTEGMGPLADAGFSVAAVAILLASRLPARRKAWSVAVLIVLIFLVEVVARLSGIGAGVEAGMPVPSGAGYRLAAAAYHTMRVGVPIAVVLVAAQGHVPSLWTAPVSTDSVGGP